MTGLEPPRCMKPECSLNWHQVCLALVKPALEVRSSERFLDKKVGPLVLTLGEHYFAPKSLIYIDKSTFN
jgi:hypothetical protein